MEALKPVGIACLSSPCPLLPKPPSMAPFPVSRPSKLHKHPMPATRSTKWADRLLTDFQLLPSSPDPPSLLSVLSPPPLPSSADRSLPLPLHFYQILGAEAHFLADGVKRAFEARVSRPPQYGYSQEALLARRQILQAACETLMDPSSRAEYTRGLLEDPGSTLTTRVPWDKVPGALCVLQEAGQAEMVLQIGAGLLLERLPKQFKQDVVLAMALAYVDQSREAMALSPPDFVACCEVLERALKLLQEEGASNLALDLQAQIDETLEEITPRCVLELLAMPLDEEYRIRREEGLLGVRNILWSVGGGGVAAIGGGFNREEFMNEAFLRMTASEQVELFATTPSNILAERSEVYGAALAYVAEAFVCKKPHLIKEADRLFLELQQTKESSVDSLSGFTSSTDDEINFALERALCSLLVGDLDGCHLWLGIDSENSPHRDPSILEFILENSDANNENDLLPGICKLLETWLTEVVFPRFRDTKDVQFRLGDYYDDPSVLRYLEGLEGGGASPLAAAAAIVRIGAVATNALGNVKSSAFQALQKVLPLGNMMARVDIGENNGWPNSSPEMQNDESIEGIDLDQSGAQAEVSREPSSEDHDGQDLTYTIKDTSIKIMCGGLVIGFLTLAGLKFIQGRNGPSITGKEIGSTMVAMDASSNENLVEEIPKMDARLAENLVCKWQNVKSHALGPDHYLAELPEVLDGRMLKIWSDRAAEISQRGWFWEYKLLGVTIDSVTVSVDGNRAMVEATIEEAAHLTDPVQPEHNDSYNTTYTSRYEMSFSKSGWKITEGAVLKS
ncbi:Protein ACCUMULATION AND REPLICATION OF CHLOROPLASTS 6-like IMS domain-containing protein [Dioscorea alata]|uniref:Protein ACCUMULATION AND REPLICATION OF CHLOROPLASTS 6-like IMS domain-containing protein n=1 Tax=Dioscorea alata TaxID=55571 RepID=A0ACB7WW94_DIOAL|nr:Protein ACCUMULATION AND REPLICATION OF CHLOROPLASTS 6-like IMS domain-containing protein [Dioscorea alata]